MSTLSLQFNNSSRATHTKTNCTHNFQSRRSIKLQTPRAESDAVIGCDDPWIEMDGRSRKWPGWVRRARRSARKAKLRRRSFRSSATWWCRSARRSFARHSFARRCSLELDRQIARLLDAVFSLIVLVSDKPASVAASLINAALKWSNSHSFLYMRMCA